MFVATMAGQIWTGWHAYNEVFTGSFVGLESDASSLHAHQALLVPGLLQTEDYVAALGALTGNQNILKNDSGTLVLTGVSTRTGLFQVNNGAVLLTGRLNDTTANSIQIAPTAGQTGAIYVNGGTLNAGGDLRVGFADGASGFLRINNGVVTSGAQTLVGGQPRRGYARPR